MNDTTESRCLSLVERLAGKFMTGPSIGTLALDGNYGHRMSAAQLATCKAALTKSGGAHQREIGKAVGDFSQSAVNKVWVKMQQAPSTNNISSK